MSKTSSDENLKKWTKTVLEILNRHAPIKCKRVKRETQPEWLNEDIKAAGKKRDSYHKQKDWKQFKYWRNQCTSLTRLAKRDFFSTAIANNKDNSYLWKHIKNLNGQSSKRNIPDMINVDGLCTNDPKDIIEKLIFFFYSISDKLKADNPTDEVNFDCETLTNYVNSKVPNGVKFKIPLMKHEELLASIKSIDTTKASGLDGITPRILKMAAEIVCPTLLELINICITTGQFPDDLKIAKLMPIHKGGSTDDPSNYRPISILPVISKLVEKHVTKHLFGFLNKYKLLHKSQSGFRKHHSCNTALINLVDKWLKAIDKGEIVGAIFFDLKKAFDVVNHEKLLMKLKAYKFDNVALNWMKSFLSNRRQCIVESKLRSSMQPIKSGVPQGSVLGPVLFLLFVNDLPLFVNETYLEMYADDTTLHFASRDENALQSKLQGGAVKFDSWCQSNDMFINLLKTSLMLLGSRQNLSKFNLIEIILESTSIQHVESQKLLGIIIDKTLSWDKQVDSVCLNITRRITLLKHLSKYVNQNSLKQYYNAYILPVFDYGCIIWSRGTAANTDRMLRLQKRAARIILHADRMTPSKDMFQELQWLPFSKRIQYHVCIMMYKTLNDSAPDYMSDMFIRTSETHDRNLRSVSNDTLKVPFARTKYFENSFAINGAKQWNALPLDLREMSDLGSFKTAIKKYLL